MEIVWQLADASGAPDYVRVVRPRTPRALAMIATSRWIVDNFNRPQYMRLFPGQSYLQTWHGDRGFKKMLFDMDPGAGYPDGEQITLALSGSDFGTKNYRSAFRYAGPVQQLGIPRNDRLARPDPAEIAAIRARLGVPDGVRVMLYAPTFRDATSGRAQRAGFDLRRALSRLESATGSRWMGLVRAHDQNRSIDAGDSAGAVRDVTRYPEMSDLLLAADLLITDYSSSAGDFILLDRPVVLYQPDLAEFTAGDRDMYFDVRTCPTRARNRPRSWTRCSAAWTVWPPAAPPCANSTASPSPEIPPAPPPKRSRNRWAPRKKAARRADPLETACENPPAKSVPPNTRSSVFLRLDARQRTGYSAIGCR